MTDTQLALAPRMINASICAYQIYAQGVKPNDDGHAVARTVENGGYFYDVVPFFQDEVGFVAGSASYTPAFTAVGDDRIDGALAGLTEDGYAVLAIRGTIPPSLTNDDLLEWIKDWAQDADVPPIAWQPAGEDQGKVETGFATAVNALWPWIESTLEPLLAKAPKGLLVTGHSKGAAATFLAASRALATWPALAGKIQVHAFAAPVAGDADFAQAYAKSGLAASTYRYQVQDDLVPFLPLWTQADVFAGITFASWKDEAAWIAFVLALSGLTGGGYTSVGSFTYFDSSHQPVPGAVVGQTALPAVVAALNAEEFATIADAHGAVASYLPCFQAPSCC